MPVTKTTYKRRYYKRKSSKITPKTVASIARKAVKKLAETKKHSLERTEIAINTNSGYDIQGPLQLPSNTGHGARIGHKVTPIGLDIRGHVVNHEVGRSVLVKMMVVRIKDNLATLPGDLLETNSGNVSIASNDVSKLYRRINSDSFEVLASKFIALPGSQGSHFPKFFRTWINMKKFRTLTYEGNAAADPLTNDIRIIFVGADPMNDVGSTFEVSYNSTFYFKDM